MSDTYVVGKTVEEFKNSTDTYLFAIRKTDEGDLYLLKSNISEPQQNVELFGHTIPAEFQSIDYPGDDYLDGRAEDHTLENTRDDVKYEQWKWVNRTQSYYIDQNGFFTLAVGENRDLSEVDDIIITPNHVTSFTLVGEWYDVDLRNELIKMGWNGISRANVTITGNLHSSTPINAALTVKGDFPNGINITNNGNIFGCNGNSNFDPLDNRNYGVAISIETGVLTFTNGGTIKAGIFDGNYANAFRGYILISSFVNDNGSWIGYDD